jgi:aminoglycoside 6'-N-acetyltransferase
MTAKGPYEFRAARIADLDLLQRWQNSPHVSRWWGSDDRYDEEKLADPRVCRWIVSLDRRPFAYMQDYAVHGWGQHHFDYLPDKSRGIDQYIGDVDMLGKGHGKGFIRQRIMDLFDNRVPVLATDPHPKNARAISVYEGLGFRIVGPEQQTEWGCIVPMEARPIA